MNRDLGRGTNPLPQTPSSSYLIYLFLISVTFVLLLPYLFPLGGTLLRSSKKESTTGKLTTVTYTSTTPSTYTSLSSDAVLPKIYAAERGREEMEMTVGDLQRMIQVEREKSMHLENEIRLLHLSERFLKERIKKLEERSFENRRSFSGGSVPIELLMEKSTAVQTKQDNLDMYVQELLRTVQSEKEKTNALASELKIMRMSEAMLVDRIKALEEKINGFISSHRETYFYDSTYDEQNPKRD